MQIPRIDAKNAMGLAEKFVGLGKEVLGTITDRERLTRAGQVQQEKATERLKAVRAALRADSHEGKAAAAGRAQKSAQKTKETVNS